MTPRHAQHALIALCGMTAMFVALGPVGTFLFVAVAGIVFLVAGVFRWVNTRRFWPHPPERHEKLPPVPTPTADLAGASPTGMAAGALTCAYCGHKFPLSWRDYFKLKMTAECPRCHEASRAKFTRAYFFWLLAAMFVGFVFGIATLGTVDLITPGSRCSEACLNATIALVLVLWAATIPLDRYMQEHLLRLEKRKGD